jgi:hypothetical protein
LDTEQAPVFVTGITQSGKTLLSLMLGSHPCLATSHLEPRLWARFHNRYGDLRRPANLERCLKAMLDQPSAGRLIRQWPAELAARFRLGEPTYVQLFGLFFAEYAASCGKARWVDHSQDTQHHASQILAAWPAARMIHLIRDPRDWYAALQMKSQRTRGATAHRSLVRDVCHWVYTARRAAAHQARWPNQYRIVRYEDLVDRTAETLHEVCAFIGGPPASWPDITAWRVAHESVDYGLLSAAHRRIYLGQLSAPSVALIQAMAGAQMRLWAYPLEPERLPPLRARWLAWLGNGVRLVHQARCTFGRYRPRTPAQR